jgi:glycine cleavage system H protein
MNIPKDLKYTKTHEWVKVEGGVAVVGIADHAQHELTDIVYAEAPAAAAHVEAARECAVVESVKSASNIYSPVSGQVVAANEELGNAPGLLNRDPYGKGWMFKVKMSNPVELDKLLTADDYSRHIA